MSSTLLSLVLVALLSGQSTTPTQQTASQQKTREASLADALIAAPAAERVGVLDAAREAWGPELSRALLNRAIALRQARMLEDSMAVCEVLAWVAERIEHPLGVAWAENGVGVVMDWRGDVPGALPHFENAARIAEEAGDTTTLIAALNNAGKAYENLGELAISQERLRRMLSLAEQAGNARLTAHGHAALGQSLTRSDDYREARVHLERGLAMSDEQRYISGQILSIEGLQILHTVQGDFDRALEMASRLRAMEAGGSAATGSASMAGTPSAGGSRGGGAGTSGASAAATGAPGETGSMNTGLVHVARGDYAAAIRDFEQALAPLEDRPLNLGPLLYRLGEACLRAGRYDDALRHATRGLEVAGRAGHRLAVVNALSILAEIRLKLKDANGALDAASRAADMAAAMGGVRTELTARVTAGRAQRVLGRDDDARRSFEAAIELAETIRGRVAGDEVDRQRLFEQVVAPYQELVAMHAAAGRPWDALTYAERAKGRVLLDVLSANQHLDAEEALSQTERDEERRLRLAHAAANLTLARARESSGPDAGRSAGGTAAAGAGDIGALTARVAETRRAYDAFRSTLFASHPELQVRLGNLAPLTHADLASLLPDARSALVEFVVTDDRAYILLAHRPTKSAALPPTLRTRPGSAARRSVTRCMIAVDGADGAKSRTSRACGLRAIAIASATQPGRHVPDRSMQTHSLPGSDSLASAAPSSRLLIGAAASEAARPATASTIRPLPGSDTANLNPSPWDQGEGQRREFELEVIDVPIARASLARQVTEYRAAIAARAFSTKKSGAALHELLLARVRAKTGSRARLVIVPDDSLWELPFHTLVDRRGRYVLDDAVVAYAPSLATLREMTALARRRAAEPAAVELLAVGDPTPAEGPRIPHAAREVNAVASIYGASRSRVFVGTRADEARFREQAGQARRIHVAAHGVLDSRAPLHSYVALAPGTAGDDGLLEARELMHQRLRAELLVLSACETARGRIGAGEGLIGLGWAAFLAGSASTVVSQWKVDSRSTADLMIAFHRALQPDASGRRPSTAAALRHAALATARTPQYAHPFYWAGFVAIGDPR